MEESKAAMKELQQYQDIPLTKQDKVMAMQGWNKALAFTTAFSEALLIYWRITCCEGGKKDPALARVQRESEAHATRHAEPTEPLRAVRDGHERATGQRVRSLQE